MRILDGLRRLKIVFNITEGIERSIYLYILLGDKVHIDTSVTGSEARIAICLAAPGRNSRETDNIL